MKKYLLPIASIIIVSTAIYVCAKDDDPDRDSAVAIKEITIMKNYMGFMNDYIEMSKHWLEVVEDETLTQYLVVERITELYEKKGMRAKAVPVLESLLEEYKLEESVQRAVKFKIAEIHKETGKVDKAVDSLKSVLEKK